MDGVARQLAKFVLNVFDSIQFSRDDSGVVGSFPFNDDVLTTPESSLEN